MKPSSLGYKTTFLYFFIKKQRNLFARANFMILQHYSCFSFYCQKLQHSPLWAEKDLPSTKGTLEQANKAAKSTEERSKHASSRKITYSIVQIQGNAPPKFVTRTSHGSDRFFTILS